MLRHEDKDHEDEDEESEGSTDSESDSANDHVDLTDESLLYKKGSAVSHDPRSKPPSYCAITRASVVGNGNEQ